MSELLNSRLLAFTDKAWTDYTYWQTQDKKTLKRINLIIKDIQRDAFEGIAKPEALKGNLTGYWSRRIDESNRIIYAVDDGYITIIACRYHYDV